MKGVEVKEFLIGTELDFVVKEVFYDYFERFGTEEENLLVDQIFKEFIVLDENVHDCKVVIGTIEHRLLNLRVKLVAMYGTLKNQELHYNMRLAINTLAIAECSLYEAEKLRELKLSELIECIERFVYTYKTLIRRKVNVH